MSFIPNDLKEFSIIIPKDTIISSYLPNRKTKRKGFYFTYYYTDLNKYYENNGSFLDKCTDESSLKFFRVIKDL